tara:strand:+ start:1079 stop:1720 length:642 start_codon:yes stop_codon:yes gene_type:complete
MPKKCPAGIICIENFTFLFFGLLITSILVFMYIKNNNILNKKSCNCNKINCNCDSSIQTQTISNSYENPLAAYFTKQDKNDILLNPYTAPLRDDRIFNNTNYNGPKMPINIPTQSIDTNYRQVGILTRENGAETILPLMGRPLFSNRDKWNFYTMNDKNNMIKLPISFKNKSCTNDQGCDNVYNGDTVYVEGYNDVFKATIYDNNTMQYIPYL